MLWSYELVVNQQSKSVLVQKKPVEFLGRFLQKSSDGAAGPECDAVGQTESINTGVLSSLIKAPQVRAHVLCFILLHSKTF